MGTMMKFLLLTLALWLLLLVYMLGNFYTGDPTTKSSHDLARALAELEKMKQQNEELRRMADELRVSARDLHNDQVQMSQDVDRVSLLQEQLAKCESDANSNKQQAPAGSLDYPSKKHEQLQRKLEDGTRELWFLVKAQLKLMKSDSQASSVKDRIDNLLLDVGDHQRTILADAQRLRDADGGLAWRQQEAHALQDLVQRRLHYLQNPKDCSKAKKLLCNLNKGCGYGCQLHHVVYCFMVAYGTERTMILNSQGWRYSSGGWEKVFLPLSETCTDPSGASRGPWKGDKSKDTQVVEMPIVDSIYPRPPYLPLGIPEDLSDRLLRLHGNPSVWFIAQFVLYLQRYQPYLQQDIEETAQKLGFQHPIVGIHVRRTDKINTEAAYHSIAEYMEWVEEYYQLLQKTQEVKKKRVYLATDEPNLLTEAQKQYPEYQFVSDNAISKSAGLSSRYTDSALRGVIIDIHFLAHSDYLVCTFSSQVCRVAYEIMQTLKPDAAANFHSLDDIYYFGGQGDHNQVAIAKHEPRTQQEIYLEQGDEVGIAGNHWDGYSKGVNRRTHKSGLYPSYKVEEKIELVKYPTYPEVEETS
ncbi:FUT8 [Branchiostoma lanceolatum]|uniref:Alpha-(1,6)-fucosyltransferase n=1 Tax=Branchiostoma lanceolatum TaxID=7740 RepID=A0A8J9ZVX7_BRALA|nr:FUT8 [Branchiostoma lanceolatum]